MASEAIDYFNTPEDSERLYKLLNEAKAVAERCRKARNSEAIGTDGTIIPPDKIDAYCQFQFKGFSEECQWASGWIYQELANNPVVSTDTKSDYQKQWADYINRIYRWLDSVLFPKDGSSNILIEYRSLESIRNGLFWQSCIHLQERVKYAETEEARLKEKLTQQAKGTGTKSDHASTKQNTPLTKREKIIVWFKGLSKELYGMTIERITKAYLDKYG